MADLLAAFEATLSEVLAERYPGAGTLETSVRYVMQAGGKRVRPILCLLAADAVGGDHRAALPAAMAVEMIHTYSLVHDDLPCMDNDDLRRGRATAHKVFGDANALLAGDALLTDAFAVLAARALAPLAPPKVIAQFLELANAAGSLGMVQGQSLDLHWTARPDATPGILDEIHLKKTGCLLGAASALGAIAGGATEDVVARLRTAGLRAGLAFQILDDLLDAAVGTGKSPGKDAKSGKLTYLSFLTRAEAEAAATRATDAALASIDDLGPRGEALRAFLRALLHRQS